MSDEIQEILQSQAPIASEPADLPTMDMSTQTGPELTREDVLSKLKDKFKQKQKQKEQETETNANGNRRTVIACNPNFDQHENAVIFCTDQVDIL